MTLRIKLKMRGPRACAHTLLQHPGAARNAGDPSEPSDPAAAGAPPTSGWRSPIEA